MNVQAHISAGQVPNQGLPQQNVNALQPNQMQNLVGGDSTTAVIAGGGSGGGVTPQRNLFNVDPDLLRARGFMRDRIFAMLLHRQTQTTDETQRTKFKDISKRLEEGLFKAASTKEDYMNMDTLEARLSCLIKGRPANNHNQRHQRLVNSSSSIGTMIPTPGMSHSGNSSLIVTSSVDSSMIAASGCNTIAPTTVNSGSLLSTGGIQSNSYNRSDGTLSNGYQQSPANFSIGSSGNMPSMGVQRIASQMIPTPGFNNNSNQNNSSSNQSYMNLESNNGGGFSTVESTVVSLPQQQKQHVFGQNSRILHNLGSPMGSGMKSGLQHKSYGFSNGALNGGLGMIGNNLLVNELGTSEGYLTGTQYANSPKSLQHHFDHQQPMMQGDGYGGSNADSYGTGNFYGAVTPVGSMTNTPNMNSASLQSMHIAKTSAMLMGNQSNFHVATQCTQVKAPSIDQSEKMNFHSPLSSRDNLLQSQQQQQFPQQPHHVQQQQFVQHQRQQKPQSQQQYLLNNDGSGHSQMMSDMISQVKREPGMEQHNEVMHPQGPEQFQLPDSQNQFQLTSPEDRSRGAQHLSVSSGQHDICSSLTQMSQPMQQMLHSHQLVADSHNVFNCFSIGQSESVPQGQRHSQSQEKTHMARNMSHEQHVQEDFMFFPFNCFLSKLCYNLSLLFFQK